MKRYVRWLAALLLICLAVSGAAESVRVVTPGGSVKVRKSASDKGRLVTNVPNYTLVELVEEGEAWSEIKYKNYTGFVKNEFLRLPSALTGKTVFPDEGTLILRESTADDADMVGVVSQAERVTVLTVEEDWAWVRAEDGLTAGAEGWVPALSLSWHREEPAGEADWTAEPGTLTAEEDLRRGAGSDAPVLAHLEAGRELTVMAIDGDSCLVLADETIGYLPVKRICLTGIREEDRLPADEAGRDKAEEKAAAALRKRFKAFKNEHLYTETTRDDRGWRIGFYSESGQYRYAARVEGEKDDVTFTADYTAFASPVRGQTVLPRGQLQVTLSTETLAAGEVLDVEAAAWEGAEFAWKITLNGKALADTKPGDHFKASFRPREAGEYELTVTASDETKLSKSEQITFTVTECAEERKTEAVYSQKDGSWRSAPYRDRNLEGTGCAIFALSHALHRMGFEGEETEPAALAKKYSLCLTPTGTNNERLIRTAGRDFGFKTRSALIGEPDEIAERLRNGQMFSFAIVLGHIAMIDGISEDGSMVHVVDSAPSATYERIKGETLYLPGRTTRFIPIQSLDDIPGARWYPETKGYGGLEYWLPLSYVAGRGVRLIEPAAEE